ncbi:unnamed protein product [Adineta ricciae]|uniref:Uncharacterized protein n=1 Tax=Adineta ricciae TaxID=249248 RepID=A0A814EZK2_ADIRI|nr:unnamed protein product [Adineta ricciae]CAF1242513.1 unnamed protein product [Adineta ricciae]
MYHSVTFEEEPSACSSSEPTKSDISASSNGVSLVAKNFPGDYGTVGSGRLGWFSDYFLAAGFRPEVQTNLSELAGIGENCVEIEKSCTGTDSDFNGSSRRNDRPGLVPPPPYSSGDTDEDVDYAPDDEHPVPILRESAESKKEATPTLPPLDAHLFLGFFVLFLCSTVHENKGCCGSSN